MAKKAVTVIFDRLGAAKRSGRGKIEIRVYLSANVRKYIVVGETSRLGWKTFQHSIVKFLLEALPYCSMAEGKGNMATGGPARYFLVMFGTRCIKRICCIAKKNR